MESSAIAEITKKQLNAEVKRVYEIGKGASGNVYGVEIDTSPYKLAVKQSEHYDAMLLEKQMLEYLGKKVSYKVPKPYFLCCENKTAYLAMELIDGVSGRDSFKLLFVPDKKRLANEIVDSFISTQSVHSNKFGKFDNPNYDTWKDYYRDFFYPIYDFTKEKYQNGEVIKTVFDAVELVHRNFDFIFDSVKGKPSLCHGDFWAPNMIIDIKNSRLAGVIDPFNMLYAEPEYELFSLTLGFGKKLRLYELYKSKVPTSSLCDFKVEMYALLNELNWYMFLNSIGHKYLKYRAERLIQQAKKASMKV